MFSIVFRMYCEPVLCAVSLIGNITVLIGMARVKHGFSRSVRFYYSMLAIGELLLVDGLYFVGDFLETGIAYLVSGGTYYPILTYDATDLSCKLLSALWLVSDNIAGYTLVCLGIERIIAVTWPLRAKTILTLRFSVLLETTIVLLANISFLPLLLMDYTLVPQYGCWYDYSLPYTRFYIMLEIVIPLLSSLLSLGFSAYLVVKLILSMLARRGLSNSAGISARELSNIATLLFLDVAHVIVYIPDGIFYWMYSLTVVNPDALNAALAFTLYRLANIFDELLLVPHALTFFILFFRSGAFRKALCGKCFAINGSSQTEDTK